LIPAAEISKYFDMDQLDDTLGGPLPEDGMWDFESYGERMRSMDAALKQQLEVVTAALAPGSSP